MTFYTSLCVTLLGLSVLAPVARGGPYSFAAIDVPGGLAGSTWAQGINNAGQIVGIFQTCPGSCYHGFLDTNGTFTTIDAPGAVGPLGSTYAHGINAAGQIVGIFGDASGAQHGFLDTNGTFTTIDAPGADGHMNATFLQGIDTAGQIIGFVFHYANSTSDSFLDSSPVSSP